MLGVQTLLTDTTGSATGGAFTPNLSARGVGYAPVVKFQAHVAGTGAVSATVLIECTNDASVTASWMTLATITLSGTTTATDGYATIANWPNVRAKCTAISGTGATVTVTMGL